MPPIRNVRLDISNPAASLEFYVQRLGMRLRSKDSEPGVTVYHLSFDTGAGLRLRHDNTQEISRYRPGNTDAYWKIGITIADVDVARARLKAKGIQVTKPMQFHDIGYLCHLEDPDGYCIELLQHRFSQNHRPAPPSETEPLGNTPNIGQVSLNVSSIEQSLAFYQTKLGWKLLSRQQVPGGNFTLWFLGSPTLDPPSEDVDAIENREWLWSLPDTTLELRAYDRIIAPRRAHPPGKELGFRGVEIDGLEPGKTMQDPDGINLTGV